MTLPFVYRPVAALKRVLLPADQQADTTLDADLEVVASAVGWAINQYTHRTFVPFTATKVFDAPAATCLALPDLQTSPLPVVSFNGVTLTAGTDFVFDPHETTELQPVYTALIRMQGGLRVRWGWRPQKHQVVSVSVSRGGLADDYLLPSGIYDLYAPGPSESTIAVTGRWGYTDLAGEVPPHVGLAHEILTTEFWKGRETGYAFQQAQPPGAIKDLARQMIENNPYVQFLLMNLVWQPEQEGISN